MACIFKAPSDKTKGVLVLTTQERDHQVNESSALQEKMQALKQRWIIGLHHNWHDHKFRYNLLYDFSMAGEGDLIEVSGRDVPRVAMDACNFVPDYFRPGQGEKFWDVLYVARAVFFKKIPEFFTAIRKLYDQGHKYRVLFICPVPAYDPSETKTILYDIRKIYDKKFSESEKDLFNLLTMDYRYPFPFDLETIAHFYRSSKVFVHTADDERRCRVAAYAWACGVPVVGMDCVASLLHKEHQRAPYFFEVQNYKDFPSQIKSAVESVPSHDWDQGEMNKTFLEKETVDILDQEIHKIADVAGMSYQLGNISPHNLSIRLGRHHLGQTGPNSLDTTLQDFVTWLESNENELADYLYLEDPEREIEKNMQKGVSGLLKRMIS